MHKYEIKDLFIISTPKYVDDLPSYPERGVKYLLISNKTSRLFSIIDLFLSKTITNKSNLNIRGKYYIIKSRKCVGTWYCPDKNCHYTKPISNNKQVCLHHENNF